MTADWTLSQEEVLGHLQKNPLQKYSIIFAEPAIYTPWDLSWRLPDGWDTQDTSKEQQWKDWTREWVRLAVDQLDENGILYLGLQKDLPKNPIPELFPESVDITEMQWIYMTPELAAIPPSLVTGIGNIYCIKRSGSREFPEYSEIPREDGIPTLRYAYGIESFLCRQEAEPRIHVCPEDVYVNMRDRVTIRVRKPVEIYSKIVQGHLENREPGKALCLFAGSGSEMVACMRNGVPCHGVEYGKDQVDYIRARIEGRPCDIEEQYLQLDSSRDWFVEAGTTPEQIEHFMRGYRSIQEEV